MATSGARTRRHQNRWGEGDLLRGEILTAARELLEQVGNEAGLSLRAVARQVGITAPSIYVHFPDRDSLVAAVIAEVHDDYAQRQSAALTQLPDGAAPRDQLGALITAFIAFAHEFPASTQVLFARPHPSAIPAVREAARRGLETALAVLHAAVPSLTDHEVRRHGQLIWAATYGLAILPPHHPRFDWLQSTELVDGLLDLHLRQ